MVKYTRSGRREVCDGGVTLNTDYKIEAIKVLLNEDCILTRYYSLIPYKDILVENLNKMGCDTKSDCMKLSDEALLGAGLPDIEMVRLFRAFLVLYDIKTAKLKGFSLKGTKIDQWVKAGTGQEKTRSSKRWSDFSLYTDENSSEVTTISELFGFYEFIFGVIPMLSSSSASSSRLWTFSFLYAFLR